MMSKPRVPKTPHYDRLNHVYEDYRVIEEFLEWVQEQYGLDLCKSTEDGDWDPCGSIISVLNCFYDIDSSGLEKDRRALLEYQRRLDIYRQQIDAHKEKE